MAIIPRVALTTAQISIAGINSSLATLFQRHQKYQNGLEAPLPALPSEYLLHASTLKKKQKAHQKKSHLLVVKRVTQSKDIS